MSIKLYLVKCSVHGEYEITALKRGSECPTRCILPTENGLCSEKLTRVYTTPAVHYKGSGWAGKEK